MAVYARVKHYRKRGVAFPNLVAGVRGRPRTNPVPVSEMNSIVSRAMEYRPALPDAVRPAANGRLVGSVS